MTKLQLSKALIKELAEVLKETDMNEIEYGEGDRHIRLSRGGSNVTYASMPQGNFVERPSDSAPAAAAAVKVNTDDFVTSPMVGTAYISAEPGAPPFVTVGQSVSKGQTVIIIEAMKVMNPIKAHKSGKIKEICVDNAQPVEFGDSLVIIE